MEEPRDNMNTTFDTTETEVANPYSDSQDEITDNRF